MIKLDVICEGKNGIIENGATSYNLTFRPTNDGTPTHATGAVIGTPNAPKQVLTNTSDSVYTVLNTIIVTVTDASEADKYVLGDTYTLSIAAKTKGKV